jgi:hypothetical protein
MNNRKPFNKDAGYIASRHNDLNNGWVVIYKAAEQGLDVEGKYAVVCKTHGSFVGASSLPSARPLLKVPDFCDGCRN